MSEQQEQQSEAGGERAPTVIVFAGPNGSGKSTTTARVLDDPELKFDGEYINADDIAKGLEGAIADPQARNLKAAQIAEDLHLNASTVRSRLMRGRRTLREALEKGGLFCENDVG